LYSKAKRYFSHTVALSIDISRRHGAQQQTAAAACGGQMTEWKDGRTDDFSFRSSTEFRKNCRKRTEINSFVD